MTIVPALFLSSDLQNDLYGASPACTNRRICAIAFALLADSGLCATMVSGVYCYASGGDAASCVAFAISGAVSLLGCVGAATMIFCKPHCDSRYEEYVTL